MSDEGSNDDMRVEPDAVVDTSRLRLQVLLAARGGCRDPLADVMAARAAEAAGALGDEVTVRWLVQMQQDPFPAANPLCRPYEAVLELECASEVGRGALVRALGSLPGAVEPLVHLDLSGVLVGNPQRIIPCDEVPLRYLYVMRRKAGTSHQDYIDYYFHHHSRFGFRTPGIAGYVQFHVDAVASRDAALALGLGMWGADSVSELYFAEGLDDFFAGTGDGSLAGEAGADEDLFVDRDNSVSFCTHSHRV